MFADCRYLRQDRRGERAGGRAGFTLVELLVVIAIISILAGLLLPALTTVLKSARQVACLSQLKQIGMFIQLYGDDHDDALVPVRKVVGAGWWDAWFEDYTGTPISDKGIRCSSAVRNGWDYSTITYGMNVYVHSDAVAAPATSDMHRFSMYPQPSGTLSVADGNRYYLAAWANNFYDLELEAFHQGLKPRHLGQFNLLYLDLHATRYDQQIYPPPDKWVTSDDALFWNGTLGWIP